MRTRSITAAWMAIAVAALAAAGCGSGDGGDTTAAEPPKIPPGNAWELAGISDRIAAELDAGDVCTAAQHADELSDAVERARLPARYSEVEAVASDLVNQVNCPPPPEPEPEPKKKDEEKKDEGGDDRSYENAELPGVEQLPPGQAKKIDGGGDE